MSDISTSHTAGTMNKSGKDKLIDQQAVDFYSSEERTELSTSNSTVADCTGLEQVDEELYTNGINYEENWNATGGDSETDPSKMISATANEINPSSGDFDSNVDFEIATEESTYLWSLEEDERWMTSSEGNDNTTYIDNSSATENFIAAADVGEQNSCEQVKETFIEKFDNDERTLIDTPEKLEAFLPTLLRLKPSTREAPELTLDSEGWNLGMYGTLTVLQMRIRSLKHTYIFDVLALEGKKMFETEGAQGQSLKKILESKEHIQLWWDIRQDSEAMFHHYDILVGSRIDVQLMELATRKSYQNEWLRGLVSAVWDEGTAWMDRYELESWVIANKQAKYFFRGNDYRCFNERPLSFMALEYAAGDADVIERLYDVYLPQMTEERWELVMVETDNRLLRAMLSNKPRGNARAPTSFALLPNIWSAPELDEDMYEEHAVVFEETPELDSGWFISGEEVLEVDQEHLDSQSSGNDADNEAVTNQASNDYFLTADQVAGDAFTS